MARKGKLFYKIGEVCKICDVPAHVLRYWETEFPPLNPNKNRSGQRIFREKDVQLVTEIKRLLYDEGYTIAGARKQLRRNGANLRAAPLFSKTGAISSKELLAQIRGELQDLMTLLDQDLPTSNVQPANQRRPAGSDKNGE